MGESVVRILRIQLNGQLRPTHPGIKLENKDVRQQFCKEMDGLLTELTEAIRKRIASYFPEDYSVFVRFLMAPESDSAKVLVWVDDPTIRWPAGLLSRRAWKLSVPVLAHAVSEAFAERIQGIALDIDRSHSRVSSLAPMRFWSDPFVIGIGVTALVSAAWLYFVPIVATKIASILVSMSAQ
jgi:hypothetical protein